MANDYHTSEDTDRLNRIHAARTTEFQVLAAIVHNAARDTIVSQERIVKGEVNEVYAVNLQKYGNAILRISRHKESNFPHESWALEQAEKVGIPVPKVLAFGTFHDDKQTLHYSLQEKLTGKTFDDLLWVEHIDVRRARAITNEAGEILAKLHTVATTGYGRIDNHGCGQYATVHEMIEHERFQRRESYTKVLREHGLTSREVNTIFTELAAAERYLTQPHLIHRDYAPKHMFIDDNDHIIGIIDWEDAKSGDAAFDFSTWQFWFNDNSNVPIDWLFEGYKRHTSLGENFEERLRIAQLYLLTGLVNYYVNEAPFPKWADRGAEALRKLIGKRK